MDHDWDYSYETCQFASLPIYQLVYLSIQRAWIDILLFGCRGTPIVPKQGQALLL